MIGRDRQYQDHGVRVRVSNEFLEFEGCLDLYDFRNILQDSGFEVGISSEPERSPCLHRRVARCLLHLRSHLLTLLILRNRANTYLRHFIHTAKELLLANLPILILIHRPNNFPPLLLPHILNPIAQDPLQFLCRDHPILVRIKQLEGLLEMSQWDLLVLEHGVGDELVVLDGPGVVVVQFGEDFLCDHVPDGVPVDGFVPRVELGELEDAVVVGVEEGEDLVEFPLLFHGRHVVVDVGVGGGVQVVLELELFQAVQSALELDGFELGGQEFLEPRVAQCLLRIQPLLRVPLQQPTHQVLPLLRDIPPVLRLKHYLLLLHRLKDLLLRIPQERHLPSQHRMQYHPEPPQIALLIILPIQHLRGNILRGPYLILQLLIRVVHPQPKINEFDPGLLPLCPDHDVLGLHIPVDDVLLVHVVDGLEDVKGDSGCLGLGEVVLDDELVVELFAVEELHHDVVEVLALVELVDLDDVGVVEFDEGVDLVFGDGLVHLVLLGEDFQSPLEAQFFVLNLEYLPEGTFSQLGHHLVILLEVIEVMPHELLALHRYVGPHRIPLRQWYLRGISLPCCSFCCSLGHCVDNKINRGGYFGIQWVIIWWNILLPSMIRSKGGIIFYYRFKLGMNSLSRNIRSLERLTTLVSEESNGFEGRRGLGKGRLESDNDSVEQFQENHKESVWGGSVRERERGSGQMGKLFVIVKMVEEELEEERRKNEILERELARSGENERGILERYKEEVKREFESTMNRVLREEQARIQEIQRYYRQRIQELEKENRQCRGDFQRMKGSLQQIQTEFKRYTQRQQYLSQ